jgi:hypothetical protein
MESYSNTGSGLKKMFIAEIGAIVCAVLLVIPVIRVIGGIGAIVFTIISILGLYGAGKDIEGCKKAFVLTIANLVVVVLVNSSLGDVAVIGTLLTIAADVLDFLIVYLVCTSVGEVLKNRGHEDIAGKGELVWKINLVCYAVGIVAVILEKIPVIYILVVVLSVIIAIAGLVAGILYMIFLYKSYNAFGA